MTSYDLGRRHGLADAVVWLTLARCGATPMTAETFARALRLSDAEVRDAIDRLKPKPERVRKGVRVDPKHAVACPTCGKLCGSKGGLSAHQRQHDATTVACPDCGVQCRAGMGLAKHRTTVHGAGWRA